MMDYSYGVTNLHPLAIAVLVVSAVVMLSMRRALLPLVPLGVMAFVSPAQRVVLLDLDFSMTRLLALAGVLACGLRGELRWIRFGLLDAVMIVGLLWTPVCRVLLYGQPEAAVQPLGSAVELGALYLLFRCAIRSVDDLRTTARGLCWIAILVVPFFLLELSTGRNLFSVFGGVPEFTRIREGKLRCQGAFSHAILAGTFFATAVPLWIAMVFRGSRRDRLLATCAVASALVVIACCASSTPVAALLLSIGAWFFFPLRRHMRLVFGSAALALVGLHLVMKAPVWHLILRIDFVGGSTGEHRYRLINAAIEQFPTWWLLGTRETASWGFGLADVTNQFVLAGVRGGLWGLIAVVLVISLALMGVGAMQQLLRRRSQSSAMSSAVFRADEALVFALGAMVVVHMASFLAIAYFGQMDIMWQATVAGAASLGQVALQARSATARIPSARNGAAARRLRGSTGVPSLTTERAGP